MKKRENGVYILHNNKLYTLEQWSKQKDPTIADFVVLITDFYILRLEKRIIGSMSYNEAIKYDLPDSAQGHTIGLHRDELKPAIEAIGGDWSDYWHWTKTEYNSYGSWLYNGTNGLLTYDIKDNSNIVRPVPAFRKLSDLNFNTLK